MLISGINTELVNFTRSIRNSCSCAQASSGACSAAPCAVPLTPGNPAPWPCVSGSRFDAKPHFGLDISAPCYFLRPDVAWDLTQYALRDPGAPDNSPQRSLPIVVIDTGLQFERLSGSGGPRTMTLEPRLMYVYIPYRDQTALPLFDTSTP